ncbi:hypothetical protein Tco_1172665 [Tanacetum coccineum]
MRLLFFLLRYVRYAGIVNVDYDSKGVIIFLEALLSNDSLSLLKKCLFLFDRYYDPSSPRPPAKPPDDDGIHFDIKPDTGILTAKVVDDISEHYVLMPSILPTHPTRYPVIDTLLPFFHPNRRNKVFNLCPIFDDGDDDDEESSIPLKDIISELPLSIAITLDFPITDSLIMENEHLDTISETESDEENESSVEDLNLTPSESEDLSDIEKLNSENSNAVIESFSPSPILIEDSDSLMEEIDIFLAPDDWIPPSIENDDYDSEGDILFLKELLSNDSLSLPENESFHFDRYYGPSSPLPPVKPPDDDGIHFDIELDTEILTAKVVDDIFEHGVLMPSILPTHPTRCLVIDTLLPFSSENENKVFNSGILASNEEKSPHLLSHRGFKAFQIISDFFESPMMIYGGDSPILDVLFLHFYPP